MRIGARPGAHPTNAFADGIGDSTGGTSLGKINRFRE
jgi:hypothetical protein